MTAIDGALVKARPLFSPNIHRIEAVEAKAISAARVRAQNVILGGALCGDRKCLRFLRESLDWDASTWQRCEVLATSILGYDALWTEARGTEDHGGFDDNRGLIEWLARSEDAAPMDILGPWTLECIEAWKAWNAAQDMEATRDEYAIRANDWIGGKR